MELKFAEADLAFQQQVREFIDTHWPESARQHVTRSPSHVHKQRPEERAWYDALLERGWAVPNWPVEHGGTDWSPTQRYIWDRETVNAYCPVRSPFGASMLAPVLQTWGTPVQQERFLPAIREERVQWCQGYSEPNAGSDLANLQTRAVRDGDQYIVNGTKIWTSSAHVADWIFALVRTDPEAPRKQQGISFLLIDMTSEGVEVSPIMLLGDLHSVNTVTFTDVRVPVENLVGEQDKGWTYAKGLLTHERTGIAMVARSQLALTRLRQYATDAQVDGGTLLDQDDFKRKVSEIDVELTALEMLELRTLASAQAGEAPGPESSLLKIRGTEIGQRIADLQIEALGYYAMPYPDQTLIDNEGAIGPDYGVPVLQDMFYGRASSVFGGSNEIQKNIIAKAVLGL